MILTPKSPVLPEKYKRYRNSALGGSSYRSKTPGFHDPFSLKTAKNRQKRANVFTVADRDGAKAEKTCKITIRATNPHDSDE
jgi:hypothetical protein